MMINGLKEAIQKVFCNPSPDSHAIPAKGMKDSREGSEWARECVDEQHYIYIMTNKNNTVFYTRAVSQPLRESMAT